MFSECIKIYRTLSVDIWQLKGRQRQTNTSKVTNNTNFRNHIKNNVVVYQLLNDYWASWIMYIITCSDRHFYCVNANKRHYWNQYFILNFNLLLLNKNANCYNIEKYFKYITVINTFTEHIITFRTFSVDIWQLKCQKWQPSKTKNGKLFFWKLFKIIKLFFIILLREANLESKVTPTNRNSSAFLLHTSKVFPNVELFSILFTKFFGTNFRHQNKNNVVEIISCFVDQLSKKYCVYYVSEYLKYCSQINEYWLNKNVCMNMVLGNFFCLFIICKTIKMFRPHPSKRNH